MLTRRSFTGLGAGLAAGSFLTALLGSAAQAVEPAQVPADYLRLVHPELRAMVGPLLRMKSQPFDASTLAAFRRMAFTAPPLPAPAWVERVIPGPAGGPELKIYVVNARSDGAARPAILHTHGGGFVAGSARSSIRFLQEIAAALDCVIVSVEYRLAPEARYTTSIEENYAGLRWLHRNAAQLGADPSRIGLLGESAGGGHAALLAIAARDRGEVPLVYQALIYPMLDDRTGSSVDVPSHLGAVIWTPPMNRFGWTSFLGVEAGSSRVPAAAVPARVENLKGLPPTFIAVGSIDLFVDEDVQYARRLVDSAVPVELHVIPGGFHGFDVVPTATLGKAFRTTLVAALRQGLAGSSN